MELKNDFGGNAKREPSHEELKRQLNDPRNAQDKHLIDTFQEKAKRDV